MVEEKKESFFKKVISSIKDFERYPEFAIQRWSKVLSYAIKLLLIISLIVSIAYTYQVINSFFEISDEELTSLANEYDIEVISKSEMIEYFEGTNSIIMYIIIYVFVFLYIFIFNIVNNALNVLLLVSMAYISTLFMRMRIRFEAMFKIAIHSLTLPLILSIIAIYVETFTTFKISNYQVMYIGIAYIYIVAVLSILKIDIIKNKQELLNILEEEKRVKEEMERQEQEERNKREQNENEKEGTKEENKLEKDNNEPDDDEPQGDNT